MVSPRVQHAVTVFVNALVDEGEAILRQRYPGETLRLYNAKRTTAPERSARDMQIESAIAAGESPALIAARVGIGERRVQQIARRLRAAEAKSSA
jgi:hypothetical protein